VLAEKQGKPLKEAWETFLNSEARQKDRPRLMWAIARRAAQLPSNVLAQIAQPLSSWILRLATSLQKEPRKPFEALWSAFLLALREHCIRPYQLRRDRLGEPCRQLAHREPRASSDETRGSGSFS
jgi:hypothetical protein